MKEMTTNSMAKNTTEVFWVRDAREDFPGGQRALTMTVTDGRVQRKALWMDTMEKAENVINNFKRSRSLIRGTFKNHREVNLSSLAFIKSRLYLI